MSKEQKQDLRSLDAAVAERVIGWTRHPAMMHPTDNRTINGVLYCPPGFGVCDFGGALNYVPHYSTDIAAAMLVLDKADGMWELMRCVEHASGDEDAEFVFTYRCVLRFGEKIGHAGGCATKEEAICRAALAAIDEKGSE
jgi:hypothetical protein